jgi:hypothetical protein
MSDDENLDTVGTIDLDFHGSVSIPVLAEKHGMSTMSVAAISVSSRGRLLVLYEETPPEPTRVGIAVFPASQAETKFVLIVIDANWANGTVKESQLVNFGVLGPAINLIDEISTGFVLVSARCRYGEQNAVVANGDGSIVREICLGDGIQWMNCCNDEIVCGYFDEGVFGNYGWDQPIGSPGLVKFDLNGTIVWENREDDISDAYAMTMDDSGVLYFYYYMDFVLVRSTFDAATRCRPGIRGSTTLLVKKNSEFILLDGGYDKHDQFYAFRFNDPGDKWAIDLKVDGTKTPGSVIGRGSKMILTREGLQVSFLDWT